jgi:hypothetical protein
MPRAEFQAAILVSGQSQIFQALNGAAKSTRSEKLTPYKRHSPDSKTVAPYSIKRFIQMTWRD